MKIAQLDGMTSVVATMEKHSNHQLCLQVLNLLALLALLAQSTHADGALRVLAVLLLGAQEPVAQRGKQETHRVGPRTAPHRRSAPQVLGLLALLVQKYKYFTSAQDAMRFFAAHRSCSSEQNRAATELQQSCNMRFFAAHRAALSKHFRRFSSARVVPLI